MIDRRINFLDLDRCRPSLVLWLALLLSVLVHAVVAAMLFGVWPRAAVEISQPPLTVDLETAPVMPSPLEERVPARVERHDRIPEPQAVQASPAYRAPALEAAGVERVEVPDVVTSVPKTEAAPTIIVSIPPPVVSAPARVDVIEPPHFNAAYLNNPEPPYPPLARKLGLEGRVVLRVQVNAQGKPEQIAIAQTSGAPLLDHAALKAVQGWTFVPARRGDTPIAHVIDVPIRFRLTQ